MKDPMDWQRRFREAPVVWAVIAEGAVVALYESAEAAQFHLDFCQRHGRRGCSMVAMNVHTLELARERWGP